MPGKFDLISTIPEDEDVALDVAYLDNISTRHKTAGGYSTDRGRLYAVIQRTDDPLPGYMLVSLYRDQARTELLLTTQNGVDADTWHALVRPSSGGAVGTTLETGLCRVRLGRDMLAAEIRKVLLIVSFATDEDVLTYNNIQGMPGYDAVYGLAEMHAEAMRQLYTVDLPAAIPHVYGQLGMASLAPMTESDFILPSLSEITNPDSLRRAQGALVKAMSAEQNEHQQEFADMAQASRDRYGVLMEALTAANLPAEETAAEETDIGSGGGGIEFGEFNPRGEYTDTGNGTAIDSNL